MRAHEQNIGSTSECQWKNLYEEIKKYEQRALKRLCELELMASNNK